MSTSPNGKQHKVCLTDATDGGGRRRSIVTVGESMTMAELGANALDFLAADTNLKATAATVVVKKHQQKLQLSTSYPKKQVIDWENNKEALVQETIPHMSSIQCGLLSLSDEDNEANVAAAETASRDDSSHQKKQKLSDRSSAAAEIVDLTTSDNDDDNNDTDDNDKPINHSSSAAAAAQSKFIDDDEAFARRLQQEELDTMAAATGRTDQQQPSSSSSSQQSWQAQPAPLLDDPRDPTTVATAGDYWIYQSGPVPYRNESVLGKWLLFRSEQQVAAVWKAIATAVQSGHLQAATSKVATSYNNNKSSNNSNNKRPSSYVICVYTSEARMHEVGLRLIRMRNVRHNLHYKTDEATAQGQYANTNSGGRVTKTTLFWNNGRPSTAKIVLTKQLLSADASMALAKAAMASNNKNPGSSTQASPGFTLTEPFEGRLVQVVGLQHNYYKAKLESGGSPPRLQEDETTVILERENDNPHDPNAIRVVAVLDSTTQQQQQQQQQQLIVGYVPKKQAHVWAPWLDHGLIHIDEATVFSIIGDSTISVMLRGRACPQAQEMLDCF